MQKVLKVIFMFLFFSVFSYAGNEGDFGVEIWPGCVMKMDKGVKMEYLPVIKAGKNNGIYVCEDPMKIEERKITMKELPAVLAGLHKKYKTIVYFREGCFTEPTGAYLEHINSVLDAIAAERFNIKMGDNYLEQYGEITNFTLHIAPNKFRLGADKGEVFVNAFIPRGETELKIYKGSLKDPEVWKENYAEDFAMIFHSNRISGTTPHKSSMTFTKKGMDKPSVHISVVIDGKYEWKSYYEIDEIPENIESFIADCWEMGQMYLPQ